MFMLTQLEDSVRVEPSQLGMPTAIALEEQIKTLYFDKVINNVGLVVSFYDFVSISGGDVHNGDGGVHFRVQFNLVIFRPFEGEVLLGRIVKSNEHGITVDMGMFQDVFVPERYMQSPGSMFDASKQLWFWKYEADCVLWLMDSDVVRFKVREVIFRASDEQPKQGEEGYPEAPMIVVGDMDGDGLGSLSWWDSKDDEGA